MRIIDNPLKWMLCIGLVAALSGCGDDQQTETTETKSEQQAPEKSAAAPAEEPPAAEKPAAGGGGGGNPETHTVNAQATAFDPVAIRINPGDTVRWNNMVGHNVNTQGMGDLIPEGAEHFTSKMGEDYSRKFDVEGVYIYKCDPHYAMGMVGAIIVGEPKNMDEVKQNAKGMAKRAVVKAEQAVD